MLYIGVDLGTSAVKLLLMDGEGKIQNIVSKEYPLYFPHPGWSEQKPEDWYEQVMAGIRELIKDADKSQVSVTAFRRSAAEMCYSKGTYKKSKAAFVRRAYRRS